MTKLLFVPDNIKKTLCDKIKDKIKKYNYLVFNYSEDNLPSKILYVNGNFNIEQLIFVSYGENLIFEKNFKGTNLKNLVSIKLSYHFEDISSIEKLLN